jgi:hypothetical protein
MFSLNTNQKELQVKHLSCLSRHGIIILKQTSFKKHIPFGSPHPNLIILDKI